MIHDILYWIMKDSITNWIISICTIFLTIPALFYLNDKFNITNRLGKKIDNIYFFYKRTIRNIINWFIIFKFNKYLKNYNGTEIIKKSFYISVRTNTNSNTFLFFKKNIYEIKLKDDLSISIDDIEIKSLGNFRLKFFKNELPLNVYYFFTLKIKESYISFKDSRQINEEEFDFLSKYFKFHNIPDYFYELLKNNTKLKLD